MSNENSYEQAYDSYGEENAPRRVREAANSTTRRNAPTTRRGKAPQSVNGLHRRRRRKMSW